MKERPILFSGPMVRAILEGRKTQTRRVVKPQPYMRVRTSGRKVWFWERSRSDLREYINYDGLTCEEIMRTGMVEHCPYGVTGDRLWVREKWRVPGDIGRERASTSTCQGPQDVDFAADGMVAPEWRPSIHMPRWACRLVLEVVSVRVQRVQDISEADAIAEGVRDIRGERIDSECWIKASVLSLTTTRGHTDAQRHRAAFWDLWESINGKGSWTANPWVWVIEFRRSVATN